MESTHTHLQAERAVVASSLLMGHLKRKGPNESYRYCTICITTTGITTKKKHDASTVYFQRLQIFGGH